MMTFNSTIKSAFRNWGVLILSLGLTSCSALDLARLKNSPPSKSEKEQAQKPPIREVMIPLAKTPPSKLPESLTEIQPALDLKKPEPKGVRFTMSARGVDIKNVLFALSQEVDQNIVIDPNVNKQATVDLKNVTLEEALESLLTPLHLEYTIDEKLIRVRREQMQTRTFFMNYIISKREGNSVLESSSGTSGTSAGDTTSSNEGGNSRSTSGVESSEETDIWTELENGLKSIVTPSASTQASSTASDSSSEDSGLSDADASGGDSSGLVSSLLGGAGPSSEVESASGDTEESSIPFDQEDEERSFLTVNRQAGMILVKDFPDVLLRVAEFIENIEGSIQRQVFIQAKIIEITLNDDYKLGIDWSLVSPFTLSHTGNANETLGDSAITGATNFTYGLANSSFNIVVDALSQQGQVSVLSSPKIATLNNQRAVIKVGTDDIFFTPQVTAGNVNANATTVYEVQTVTIGIILDVVPQINPNGQIMMSINTSITEKSGERTSPDNLTVVPILDVRESNNVVLSQHGQTIVIGGLMKTKKEVDDKSVPLLGAIPYIGDLFHWSNETESKTELVIMLTPEIMAGQAVDTKFNYESNRLRNLGYNTKNSQFASPTFKR